uniref:Ig-like domain-containing protein n=1 Tax=Callorhinchus milii TaxID=7868 RepID=A0A4W3GFL0_CALMI
ITIIIIIIIIIILNTNAIDGLLSTERFTVSGPSRPVTATAGSHVVLVCKCSVSLRPEGVEIRWFRTRFDSPVYLYSEGRPQLEEQDEVYRRRAQLSTERLTEGFASLTLTDVRVTDNGTFTCFVDYDGSNEDAKIQLQVTGQSCSPRVRTCTGRTLNGGVRLLCESSGWFPAPEVVWNDDRGQNLTPVSVATVREDSKGFFSVESQIEIKPSTNTIRCVIRTADHQQEASGPHHSHPRPRPRPRSPPLAPHSPEDPIQGPHPHLRGHSRPRSLLPL